MPSDEEKDAAGQESAENQPAEREITDQFADGQAPADGDSPGVESEEQEPEIEETPEEKKSGKEKKFWLLSLGLILLLLAGGGFYAVTGMSKAAHKLGSGQDYEQLSANSTIYEGKAGQAGNREYFRQDEEGAGQQAAGGPPGGAAGDRVNPSLVRTKEDLAAAAAGKRATQVSGVGSGSGSQEGEYPSGGTPGASAVGQGAMGEKLHARAFLSPGPSGAKSAKGSVSAAAGGPAAFQGNSVSVGKASDQRETAKMSPKQAGRSSVMYAMKGSFKASLYGARLSSKDAARGWTARAFDGSAEATTAIQYEEEMRKLDKVNPDAIPGFLRDQDLSAGGAKGLSVSDVAKPKFDKEGSKEALAADKDYQAKKEAGEFSGSMINNLFKGLPGTNSPGDEDTSRAGPKPPGGPADPGGSRSFVDPNDQPGITAAGLEDFVATEGFGGECGCTAEAPCCCLPPNTASQNCPLYGPFLPNDPCGDAMYGGGDATTSGAVMAGQ